MSSSKRPLFISSKELFRTIRGDGMKVEFTMVLADIRLQAVKINIRMIRKKTYSFRLLKWVICRRLAIESLRPVFCFSASYPLIEFKKPKRIKCKSVFDKEIFPFDTYCPSETSVPNQKLVSFWVIIKKQI